MSKCKLKWKIKEKLKNEKSLKNDDLVTYMSTEGTHLASLLHSNA